MDFAKTSIECSDLFQILAKCSATHAISARVSPCALRARLSASAHGHTAPVVPQGHGVAASTAAAAPTADSTAATFKTRGRSTSAPGAPHRPSDCRRPWPGRKTAGRPGAVPCVCLVGQLGGWAEERPPPPLRRPAARRQGRDIKNCHLSQSINAYGVLYYLINQLCLAWKTLGAYFLYVVCMTIRLLINGGRRR